MWVFCKNRCVKQKKQLFPCKIDDKFTRAGVDARENKEAVALHGYYKVTNKKNIKKKKVGMQS